MARLVVWPPCLRLGREVALLAVLCAVAGFGAAAFAGEPSPGPGQSASRPDPAIRIQPRSFKDLTPHERTASYNAAWLKVEPDRMVPAEKWKSPYCIEWDDACTRCSRPDAASDPVCRPINPSEGSSCKPKITQCTRVDLEIYHSLCSVVYGVQVNDVNKKYSFHVCEYQWIDQETGRYNGECQDVGEIPNEFKDKSLNIQGWPGYSRLPNGALALSVPDGLLPRVGRANSYCADPRRDSDGWVIDKWRPGF
jgi:hypothetical protein